MSPIPFVLPSLPLTSDDSPGKSFGYLENKALVELCRLDGMMRASAKADLFWFTWLMKEAQCSNVIEGTVTTFDEVVGENAGIVVPANRRDDVQEILNYRSAKCWRVLVSQTTISRVHRSMTGETYSQPSLTGIQVTSVTKAVRGLDCSSWRSNVSSKTVPSGNRPFFTHTL